MENDHGVTPMNTFIHESDRIPSKATFLSAQPDRPEAVAKSDPIEHGANVQVKLGKVLPSQAEYRSVEQINQERVEQFLAERGMGQCSTESDRPTAFLVGINTQVVGKSDPQKLSYSGAWQPKRLSIPELAHHHQNGHPWMPAVLDGNQKRWQSNANHAEVLALDFDNGLSIEQFQQHPNAKWCALGIESSSSIPALNKFRAVFVLPRPVTEWKTIRICNQYLAQLFTHADPAL